MKYCKQFCKLQETELVSELVSQRKAIFTVIQYFKKAKNVEDRKKFISRKTKLKRWTSDFFKIGL